MQNFKVGDWVRDGENIYQFIEPSSIYSYELSLQRCELWQPKVGEWCWFWNFNEMPTLEQFSKYHNLDDHLGNYETLAVKLYQHCEPFIGELPTYLKDNT